MDLQRKSDCSIALCPVVLLLVGLLFGVAQADDSKAPENTPVPEKAAATPGARRPQKATPPVPHWFQLVNVTIPADSPIHNPKTTIINCPPKLYLIIRKNGRKLGSYSTSHRGWEVDFEVSAQNQWPIREDDPDTRYSIEIWDDNWGFNDLAFSISGLRGEQFRKVIYEKGPAGMSPDRLAKIEFRLVEKPKTSVAPK